MFFYFFKIALNEFLFEKRKTRRESTNGIFKIIL